MGKIEVRGTAERTVEYDLMKMMINFHANEETPDKASGKVMNECEEFLATLKKGGFDLSVITLSSDNVQQSYQYRNDRETECYNASRELELVCKFDMKLINEIRSITNAMKSKVGFKVSYLLSKENAIRQELLKESLLDAKKQAEMLATAIDQKIKGLISADKNEPKPDVVYGGEVLCMSLMDAPRINESYENSDELAATSTTLTESIFTVWEIE